MVKNYLLQIIKFKITLPVFCFIIFINAGSAQEIKSLHDGHGHMNADVFADLEVRTKKMLLDNGFSLDSFFAKINVSNSDKEEFRKFLKSELNYDRKDLIVKVGENKIRNKSEIDAFVELKLIKYQILYREFKAQSKVNRTPTSFMPGRGPGQPCQNMDFEAQSTFAWVGSYGSCTDPTITAGFDNPGNNSATGQHVIMTGGNDSNVPAIPCVMPGGTASLRLGDNGGGGLKGARISQTFQVQASSPYFTYNYAVVLEDAGHPVAEQPYFRIRMYDGSNNLISCATLDIDATNAPGLIDAGGLKYKNWTQVLIPLTAYIGQNVRIEFTTGDCNASGGTHDGYAYIDCSCLAPQIFTSSPAICGGSTINVTAPAGLPTYSWAGPGIVGANNTQTITVNQPGTYTVTMTTNTTPPNVPCTFSLDTIIPGNPLNPTAQFISSVVCQGGSTVFTDQSTPAGSITNWDWDFDNNGTIDNTTQNPSHTFPAAGSFPVTLTVTSGGCTDNFTSNVTVNPGVAPVINPAGPFCSNAAATTLTSNIPGGTWSGAGITNSATGAFDPAQAASGNNIISYTTAGACGGTTTATIVVNPLPPSNAGTDVVICSGDPATIGGATTAGYTYSWSPSTGLSNAAIANPSITTVNSGSTAIVTSYTVTTSANSCSTSDVVQVTVNPLPTLTITNPPAVCSPNLIDITAASVTAGSTGGGTLTYWTDPAGVIPLSGPTAISSSGTYYIKTTGAGGCIDIEPVLVTINPLPVSDAGTDVVICSGAPASIGTVAVAGYTYNWLPSTGLSAANVSNPSITTVNAGSTAIVTTYTVSTTSNSCSTSDVVQVTVNPLPVLTITDPAAVCAPGLIDITLPSVTAGSSGGGVLSYWTDAAGTIPLSGPTGIASSGTYYIKTTAAGGCTDIEPVVVTVNPLPVSDAGSDVTICSGAPVSIGTTATAGYSYAWLPASGLNAYNVSNPSNTMVNNGTTSLVTTYTVTTSVSATGCSTTDEVTVTINPLPVLNINDPAAVCAPNTVDITVAAVTTGSTGGGTLTYWMDAAATVPVSGPSAITSSGTYYIKTTAAGGCTDLEPVVVLINPVPVSDAGSDLTICTGTPGSIGAPSVAGYSYSWLPANGLNAYNISSPSNTAVNTGSTTMVTTYTVITSITATGCQSLDSVIVTINPLPVLNITDPSPVCSPLTVDITDPAVTSGTIGSGVYSYWNDAAATLPMSSPAAVNQSGTYYIQLVSGAGCEDIETVDVTVNPLPVSDAGADLTICTGSTGIIGGPTNPGFSYAWTPTNGLSSPNASNPSVTLTNITLSPVSTSYIVTTTNSATGCFTADTTVITVNPVATANAGSSQSVCSGSSLNLAGAVGGSASGGTWSGGAGTFTPDNTTLNAIYTPSAAEYAAGSVTLTLTSDDPAGPCTFASSNVTFYFYQNPVVNFTVSDPGGCPTHCASFTNFSSIVTGDTIVSWNWDFGDGSPDSTTMNPSHCFPSTGFYDVTLTAVSNHGCVSDSTQIHMVEVYEVPVAEFTPTPNPASVLASEVILNNGSSSDVISWTYYFGDGDSISPNVSSPVHLYPSGGPGIYNAMLIVENANGCRDTVEHPIEIGPEFTFFIPNAFTPNGDGVNDYFYGQGIGIKEYDIWIFDRWGNMIYHGDDINTSIWDGRANKGSDVAQQDVYVWKVTLTDVFDKKHNYIGTVTLVK